MIIGHRRPARGRLPHARELAELLADVVDDGLGDPSACVAEDRSIAEAQPQDDRRVEAMVEASDDDEPGGRRK